jgi:hypothetical protein
MSGLQHIEHNKNGIASIVIDYPEVLPYTSSLIKETIDLELCINDCVKTNIFGKTNILSLINNGLGVFGQEFHDGTREWCIIKIGSNINFNIIDELYKVGFRQFHCPYDLKYIRELNIRYNGEIDIITTYAYYDKKQSCDKEIAQVISLGVQTIALSPKLSRPMILYELLTQMQ